MLKHPIRNPFEIIWLARSDLLPRTLWLIYFSFLCVILILKFAVPDNFVSVNLEFYATNQYILLSISALTFVLSLFTFGQDIYSVDDFVRFYIRNNGSTYYKYLANYLFPSLLWLVILICSILKLMLVINLPDFIWDSFRLFYLSLVFLAILSTVYIVVNNMNRGTNKVHKASLKFIEELSKKNEEESSDEKIIRYQLGIGTKDNLFNFTIKNNK